MHHRKIQINHQTEKLLHQVGNLFELNVKLRCQKVNLLGIIPFIHVNSGMELDLKLLYEEVLN
jgi:hypothetical protein